MFHVKQRYAGGGTETFISENNTGRKILCTTIDDYVRENSIKKVDFIKADIEGSERKMLIGAKETLRKHSPKIAICTYHRPDDKEVLENLILEANPDYVVEHKWKKMYAYVPKENKR